MLLKIKNDILLPAMHAISQQLKQLAEQYASLAMLTRTHGQPASPSTLGKELINVITPSSRQMLILQDTLS